MFTYLLNKKDVKHLQTLQKVCIECVFELPRHTNVDSLHCKLKTLHVYNRRKYFLLSYIYVQETRSSDFIPDNTHSIGTQSNTKLNFKLLRPKTDKFAKSHIYAGYLLWNELLANDQMIPDLNWFKRRIKLHLIDEEKTDFL